jgi:homotetrameric cytidine deaminase
MRITRRSPQIDRFQIPCQTREIVQPSLPLPSKIGLSELAASLLGRAAVPYSSRPSAAVVLLSDGAWIPGVRVESASFSLTIPAVVNAVSTAYAAGRPDIVAIATAGPASAAVDAYVSGVAGSLIRTGPALWRRTGVGGGADPIRTESPLDVFLPAREENDEPDMETVHRLAERAFIPESNFPVACLLRLRDGRGIPGVNVEHPDWTGILCAERNALGTAVSYGITGYERLILSCPRDPQGTPCGACRQLLVEQAPGVPIEMDRGPGRVHVTTPEDLLPGAFVGSTLRR